VQNSMCSTYQAAECMLFSCFIFTFCAAASLQLPSAGS
jgi:hypothetical protein